MNLDRNDFKTWLRSHRPDEIVGQRFSYCGCPVAKYLLYKTNKPYGVTSKTYGERSIISNITENTLPDWAYKFVTTTDGLASSGNYCTAREALQTLEVCT